MLVCKPKVTLVPAAGLASSQAALGKVITVVAPPVTRQTPLLSSRVIVATPATVLHLTTQLAAVEMVTEVPTVIPVSSKVLRIVADGVIVIVSSVVKGEPEV